MSTGNKRISQLTEITAAEFQPNDLFLAIDTTAKESKKMQASELAAWLNSSGSIYSIHALIADTASYVLASNVYGTVNTSNVANTSVSSSWASSSINSSFSQTASFALNVSGIQVSASWASSSISAAYAKFAETSSNTLTSYFLYYNGGENGTASYAIVSKNSNTSSYLKFNGGDNGTASYAIKTENVNFANNTYNLIYPNNSTASYAISAGGIVGYRDYGIFLAITQSTSQSMLDNVYVNPSASIIPVNTNIEVIGTVVIPFTSSIPVNESMTLVVLNRTTGVSSSIDSSPIYFSLSPTIGNWGNYDSGTIKLPYSLMGSASMGGNYKVYVSASSNNISIDSTRINKFSISSISDTVNVNSGKQLQFYLNPESTQISFTTTASTGPYSDTYSNIDNITGSNVISTITASNLALIDVEYLWRLKNLTFANFSSNSLQTFGGVPLSLQYLDVSNCIITNISDLSYTTTSYLNCSSNELTVLPNLPSTMSYLNCSNNSITVLPTLPYGLKSIFCDNTTISSIPTLPNTLISMSFANNIFLDSPIILPTSSIYINTNNSIINDIRISTESIELKYIFVSNCGLNTTTMDLICSQSYVNAVNNNLLDGSIDITGNGTPLVTTVNNYIIPLVGLYNWSISND